VTYVTSSFPGAAREETRDGIKVVRAGGLYTLWLRTFLYYRAHGRGNYDIVVTEGFGGSRIPRLVPLYVREPIITAWHQVHRDLFAAQYPKLLVPALNLLERASAWIHRDTKVQAYTEDGKAAFSKIGFKPQNVFVVPVSIRSDWLAESDGHPVIAPNILWVGKLRRYKCPDHVIRVMPEVIKHVPTARLIIAARHDDHSYEKHLKSLASRLGVEENVDFRFDVTEVDAASAQGKRQLFRSARALVLPSSIEGFGIVVLEANSCGVPVIASSGVPEGAVRDRYNGLRYPYGDLDALTQRIVEILTNDELHSQLSTRSLESVQKYEWAKVSGLYAKVVEDTVIHNSQRS
jgi:glycosyltransferase involved in cell wall biosynthesis